MVDSPKQALTVEEAEAIIERWTVSNTSEPEGIASRAIRPAPNPYAGALSALEDFYALQASESPAELRQSGSKSVNEARPFASDKTKRERRVSEEKKLMEFEQATWDLYKLQGTLDHTRLLFECQARAQNGEVEEKRRLRVLDIFHKLRLENRHGRWDHPLNRPRLAEVNPDPQAQLMLSPRLWALLIGNNNYPQSPLRGAVNDSKVWRSYLIDFLGVPENHITHIQDAKRDTMVTALYNLRDNPNIKEGDHIIFAYSGHGSILDAKHDSFEVDIDLRAGSIEALCPVDRGLPPGRGIPDISDREVLLILSDIHDQTKANITVVLDSCHSGGGTRQRSDVGGVGYDRRSRSMAPFVDPKLIERMFTEADLNPRRRPSTMSVRSPAWASNTVNIYRPVLLAACQDTEFAYEENMHGMLTSAIMEVLRSEQRYGLTCSDLIEAIGPLRHDQKPRFDGEDAILFTVG